MVEVGCWAWGDDDYDDDKVGGVLLLLLYRHWQVVNALQTTTDFINAAQSRITKHDDQHCAVCQSNSTVPTNPARRCGPSARIQESTQAGLTTEPLNTNWEQTEMGKSSFVIPPTR